MHLKVRAKDLRVVMKKRTILVFFNFSLILKAFSFIIYNMFINMYGRDYVKKEAMSNRQLTCFENSLKK